ncbi:hypothetical protein C0991_003649, partial [Blastosporella zonata]
MVLDAKLGGSTEGNGGRPSNDVDAVLSHDVSVVLAIFHLDVLVAGDGTYHGNA